MFTFSTENKLFSVIFLKSRKFQSQTLFTDETDFPRSGIQSNNHIWDEQVAYAMAETHFQEQVSLNVYIKKSYELSHMFML